MAVADHGAQGAFARRRRSQGFTQETLAARLRVERSTVVRWEAGKTEPHPRLWPELSEALEVTPEQLADLIAGQPVDRASDAPHRSTVVTYKSVESLSDSSSRDTRNGGVFHLRQVLMGGIPDTPPRTQAQLTTAVASAWDLFFSARFAEMERALPTILASAYNTAESATGERRRQANISLAQLLHATSNLLGYVAQEDLAAVALLRADVLAAENGDALTRAAIKGSHSWLLTKSGMYDDAAAFAENAAAEIEPRLSSASPRRVAIWGELLCYAAFGASRTGDHGQARRYLRLCQSAAAQLDDQYHNRPEASNVFGSTSAASFGVINETGANRPREALKLADAATVGTGIPPTLLSRRLINIAQAQVHNQEYPGAVATLRQACSTAPEFIRHIPLARTLTDELLTRREKAQLTGLVDVADHIHHVRSTVGIRP